MVSRLEFTSSAGRRFPVELRRRKGTRHLRLSLNVRNQIVVSLPWHCSDRACFKFIEQNRKWLEQQIHAAPEVIRLREWLRHSPWLSAGGERLAISMEGSSSVRADYRIDREAACVRLTLPERAEGSALYELVRKFAKAALSNRAAEQAKGLGLSYRRLSVRDQSSRWGSCSSKRTISLNWRLVLIEPHLQDYIILHELAHLTEMNHSRRFWALLEVYDPQRVAHEAELNALTPRIMRVR